MGHFECRPAPRAGGRVSLTAWPSRSWQPRAGLGDRRLHSSRYLRRSTATGPRRPTSSGRRLTCAAWARSRGPWCSDGASRCPWARTCRSGLSAQLFGAWLPLAFASYPGRAAPRVPVGTLSRRGITEPGRFDDDSQRPRTTAVPRRTRNSNNVSGAVKWPMPRHIGQRPEGSSPSPPHSSQSTPMRTRSIAEGSRRRWEGASPQKDARNTRGRERVRDHLRPVLVGAGCGRRRGTES